MKGALKRQQDEYNISLDNVFDTGITQRKAIEVWTNKCVDFEQPKKGKDGHYFVGRKLIFIRPNSESKRFFDIKILKHFFRIYFLNLYFSNPP